MMDIFQGLLLGAVQGLTEVFPVSSSGHLILVPAFFGWEDQGLAFDAVLHFGTFFALLVFFWKDLIDVLKRSFSKEAKTRAPAISFLAKVAVATIPALAIAFFFNGWIEEHVRLPLFVAFNLVIWGVFLFLADRFQEKKKHATSNYEAVSWKQALVVGFVQPFALFPGTSRSGSTITAGMFTRMSREAAAKFSFFLSLPITAAGGAYGVLNVVQEGPGPAGAQTLVIAFVSAFLFGLIAIRFLLSYVAKKRYDIFVVYRFALAAIVILFA